MTQANQKHVITTVVIATIVLAALSIMSINSSLSNDEIESIVTDAIAEIEIPEAQVIDVPTAQEIADAIPITEASALSDSKILEGIYGDEVDDLEEECQEALEDEQDEDDIEDELRDLLEDTLEEDVRNVEVVDDDYRDSYEFEVINLGLDDEEDKEANIFVTYKIKYREVFGNSEYIYEKVEVSSKCADYDDRDNEFETLDINYALA